MIFNDSNPSTSIVKLLTFSVLLVAAALVLQACDIDQRDTTSSWGAKPDENGKPISFVNEGDLPGSPSSKQALPSGKEPGADGEKPAASGDSTMVVNRIQLIDGLNQLAATIRVADENSDNSGTDSSDLTQAERIRLQLKEDKEMKKLACVNIARRFTECFQGTTFDMSVFFETNEFYTGTETGDQNVGRFCDDFANEELDRQQMKDLPISNVEDMIDQLDASPDDNLPELMDRIPCSMIHETAGEVASILSNFQEAITFYFAGAASRFQNFTSRIAGFFGKKHYVLRSKIKFTGGSFDREKSKLIVVWTKNANNGKSMRLTKWGDIELGDGVGDYIGFSLVSSEDGSAGMAPTWWALNRALWRESLGVGHLVAVDKALEIPDGTWLNRKDTADDGDQLINKISLNGKPIGKAISRTHAFIYRGNYAVNSYSLRPWQSHFARGIVSCVKPLDINDVAIDYLYLQPAIADYSEKEIKDYILPPDKDLQSGENGCFDPASDRYAPFEFDVNNRNEINWLGNTPLGELEYELS